MYITGEDLEHAPKLVEAAMAEEQTGDQILLLSDFAAKVIRQVLAECSAAIGDQNDNDDEPFISVGELAKILGFSVTHIYRHINAYPHYRFGKNQIRFKLSEVVAAGKAAAERGGND